MANVEQAKKRTPEERIAAMNAYHRAYGRKYRQEHPEKVRQYRENSILNQAARILARREAERKAAEEAGKE